MAGSCSTSTRSRNKFLLMDGTCSLHATCQCSTTWQASSLQKRGTADPRSSSYVAHSPHCSRCCQHVSGVSAVRWDRLRAWIRQQCSLIRLLQPLPAGSGCGQSREQTGQHNAIQTLCVFSQLWFWRGRCCPAHADRAGEPPHRTGEPRLVAFAVSRVVQHTHACELCGCGWQNPASPIC